MKEAVWKRLVRRALAVGTASALLLTGLVLPAATASAACGGGQVEAVYYNWVYDSNTKTSSWVQQATACEAGPGSGSFARDYTLAGALPAGVDPASFKVTFAGSLAGTAGQWVQFAGSGDTAALSVQVDGQPVYPAGGSPYISLNAGNNFSATYVKSGTATFTLSWMAAPAAACTASQVLAIYQDPAASSRLALLVRCESGLGGGKFERKAADLPSFAGAYTATYTGQLPISEAGWYRFTSKAPSGDSLAAAADGEDLFPSPATDGYLELSAAAPLAVVYSHGTGGNASFEMTWVQFRCDTGLFLSAYYDGANLHGRAGTVRCEPMPDEASLGSAKSAKWSGKVYVEGGSYWITGTSGGQYSVDGGAAVAVDGAAVAVAEGLRTLTFTYKQGTTFSGSVINQGTGRALPLCPEGLYARKATDGSAPTCTAVPTAGASYKGRLWFQGGTYKVTVANVAGLRIDGTGVGGDVTVAEGTHDLAFSGAGGAPAVSFLLGGGCPEGAFLSEYRQGSSAGAVSFRACEPRPDYQWGAGRPPGISGAFYARWTGNVALDEAGLYTFTTEGDSGRHLTVQRPDEDGAFQSVGVGATGGARDLLPHLYRFDLVQTSSAASPAAALAWTTPGGTPAASCPDGLFRAEYYSGSLSGQPYLVTCEQAPYLSYRRSWSAAAPAGFGVRWTGRMFLDPGVHNLTLSAAGDARLYVDGALAATSNATTGLAVTPFAWDMARGWHEVAVEYRGGGELDFVRLQRTYATPAPDGSGACPTGWFKVQWYGNATLSGSAAASTCESGPPNRFSGLTPPPAITVDDWSARWTGTVNFPAGRYRFGILARNAVRVLAGGEPVVEEFTFTRPKEDGTGDESFPNRPLWTTGIHMSDAEVNFETGGNKQVVIEYATSATRASGVDPAAVPGAGLKVWWEAAGAPGLIGASFTASDTLQLRYDATLDADAAPGDASFLISSIAEAPLATDGLTISGNVANITLADDVADGAQVIVRYDPAAAGALRGRAAPVTPLVDLARGKSPSSGVTWPVDLGDVYALAELKLFGADATYEPFHVQFSLDGARWETIYTHGVTGPIASSGRPYLYVQPAGQKAAKFIRVVSVGAGAVPTAALQAWGAPSGNPAAAPSPLLGTNPVNVALGKTATMAGGENPDHPAALGINGYITKQIINAQDVPGYFLSPATDDPWWQVDLGGSYLLSSIRLHNRADCCYGNADGIIAETSADGATWEDVPISAEPFGGPHAAPYLRADLPERKAAFVRVRLAGTGQTLALAEVQVYGVPAVPSLIITNDLLAPELLQAEGADRIEVIDDVVVFRYNKPMDSASVPVPDDFAVRVDGATYKPGAVQIFGSDVSLYLPVRTDPTMIVGVKYTPSATGPVLQDVGGHHAAAVDFTEARYLAVVPVNLALAKPAAAGGGTVAAEHPAANGVNGVRYYTNESGGSKVYDYFSLSGTAPYWQVDLKDVYSLTKLRLFNRYDGTSADKAKADHLQIQLSVDGQHWQTVYINPQQRQPDPTFGVTEGELLSVPLYYENARYVRVTLPDPGTLSLAEVQVYGQPAIQTWNLAQIHPATAVTAVGTYSQWGSIQLGEQPPAGKTADERYNPARANDGDPATAALLEAGGGGTTSWKVDLFGRYTLGRINLLLADAAAVSQLLSDGSVRIEASVDGTTWVSLVAGANLLHEGNRISVTVPSVELRYLRIVTSLASLRLYEVEAMGLRTTDLLEERPLPNLARAMPATLVAAAGRFSQWEDRYLGDPAPPVVSPANSPAWAVDGNPATHVELVPLAAPDSACDCKAAWTVDLQKPHQVTKAVIQFQSDAAAAQFQSQGHIRLSADGVTWTEVSFAGLAVIDGRTHSLILPLPGAMAQFLRIEADTIDSLQLYEVEIYGYALPEQR
jgi:hypothetical protein